MLFMAVVFPKLVGSMDTEEVTGTPATETTGGGKPSGKTKKKRN